MENKKQYKKSYKSTVNTPAYKPKRGFNHLLEVIDKQLLVGLTIFPETNGTLLIDCTDKEAGISLGNDKFSYYIIKDGQVIGENGIDFSVQAITQVIKKIAA